MRRLIDSLICLDLFLAVWIIGMLVQEAKEAYRQGTERYQSQYWNLVKIFMLFLFVASGVFWLIGYFMNVVGQNSWKIPIEAVFSDKNATESAYRFVLLSNVFFSLAMVLAFFHASNFFQVSSVLGPLQLSLVTMTADIGKFLFLFLLLFLSFGFAQRKVYSRYVQAREAFAGNKTDHEFARYVTIFVFNKRSAWPAACRGFLQTLNDQCVDKKRNII